MFLFLAATTRGAVCLKTAPLKISAEADRAAEELHVKIVLVSVKLRMEVALKSETEGI